MPIPPPTLELSVQYGMAAPDLPRWRLRRWVQRALNAAVADLADRPKGTRAAQFPGEPAREPDIVFTEKITHLTAPTGAVLGLRLVDEDEGRSLNADYRHGAQATNVLTFEYGMMPDGRAHGDIVVCLPVLQREARAQDKPFLNHAAHLVVHGVLHALGYDHLVPDEADHMEALETAILASLRIPDPYQAVDPGL